MYMDYGHDGSEIRRIITCPCRFRRHSFFFFFNMAKNVLYGINHVEKKTMGTLYETLEASFVVLSIASVKLHFTKLPLAAMFF